MRKIKYILLLIIMLLSFNVKAADKCDSNELKRLRELAKKVDFSYDYTVKDNGEAVFSIKAINLNKDLIVFIDEDFYMGKYKEFKRDSNNEGTLTGFYSGDRVEVTIKGFVTNMCSGKTVLTKVIKIPYYNIFYNEDDCIGNEDFKYCKKIVDNNLTEKKYQEEFQKYLKGKNGQSETPTEIKTSSNIKLVVLVSAGIAVVAFVVTYIMKVRKKNSL